MTIFNRFQGDPALNITENGADLKFIGGQPVMDQGLHNSVIISLLTKPGWWGNALTQEPSKKIGADFDRIRTIVDVSTINEYREAARDAIRWMSASGMIKNADITVVNPYGNQIHTRINIFPPGEDVQKFLFTTDGLLWVGQTFHPASERLK